jgi:hypothetical protein
MWRWGKDNTGGDSGLAGLDDAQSAGLDGCQKDRAKVNALLVRL